MLINLAELNEKLKEYRTILTRLHDEQEAYRRKRERLSKLSQRRRPEVKKSDVECHVCNGNIDIENNSSYAACRGCERLVCRNKDKQCCEWISAIGIWECQNCNSNRAIQQKAGEWLLNQLTIRLQNPGPVDLKNDTLFGLNTTDLEGGQNSSCSISTNQKIKVREFIEELLSTMLNGPLDDVSVGQLMKNESYLPLCEGQKVPDSPSDKHFELRKLVQRIIDEVTKLPEMLNQSGLPLRPEEHLPYFSPKKYEQLLATAVLNKVIEDYRNPKNFEDVGKKLEPSSFDAVPPTQDAVKTESALNKDSPLDINHNNVSGTSLLNEINIRQMSLNTEDIHPQEDLIQRSLSESDESYLSDYIQKHTVPLPDLSDTNGSGSGPEDDLVSLTSNITEGTSWEENWLFKKRQLKTTESAIAMLVPSPTEDVKALIGDQIVDDVSDLSEADVEDYDSDNNNESGDSNVTQTTLDDEIQDSLISVNSIPVNEPTLSEAKNSLLLTETLLSSLPPDGLVTELISIEHNSGKVEAANATLLGEEINHLENCKANAVETDDVKLQQERIQNAPRQRDNEGNLVHPIGVARAINKDCQFTEYDRKEVPIDIEPHSSPLQENNTERTNIEITASMDENLIPGSIAERDILKWRNASPIPNNPYSPDVLQKRLSESNRKSNLVDFDRLSNKDNDVPIKNQPIPTCEDDKIDEQDQSLQTEPEGNRIHNQRYGRDYYINDAKRASGSRKLGTDDQTQISHSTDDEKNTSPSSPSIDRSNLLKPSYVQVKQLSPDTIKFFSPKKTFSGSTSNLSTSAALSKSSSEIRELPINTSNHMHSSLHIDFPANRNVPAHDFIIEKEVMDVLPSVKELAKCYSRNNQETNTSLKPIIKPTDFIRQSSDMLHDDQEARSGMPQVANKNRRMYSSTNSINAAEEIREIRRLNLEAYNRPTFVSMAPGHSITARSLSKQIRDELKTNATDDFKVQGGHISPERPSSPVFAPGHLRNSIQFFENLKDQ